MATWIEIGVVGWLALSVLVSLAIGGVVHAADSHRLTAPLTRQRLRTARDRAAAPPLRRVS